MVRRWIVMGLVALGCARPQGVVRVSGHVEAPEVRVSSSVGGRLLRVFVEEGDTVAPGQPVAQLDTTDLALEAARARAELARWDAAVRLLEDGPTAQEVERARQDVAKAEAELEAAERELARTQDLVAHGAAPAKSLDDARARHRIALSTVRASRAVLERLEAGARAQELEMARAQRSAAHASVALVARRLAEATVRSPVRGVVTTVVAREGEMVAAGSPVCVVTASHSPWVEAYLDEPSLARVRLGDTVWVRVDGVSSSWPGVLVYVAPSAEFTPRNVQTPDERATLVFRVKVALQDGSGILKPGMPADAYFRLRDP